MNINDYEADKFDNKTWLKDVFDKQTSVMHKYADIEGMPDWPLNVNTREGQKWFKDFLWRTTEEMMESLEAYRQSDMVHTIEELADALHFYVEFCILAGLDHIWADKVLWTSKAKINDDVEANYLETVYQLGLIGNTLKNKPWKQTEMLTDENKFQVIVNRAFVALINTFIAHGCSYEDIHSYYTRKNKVNQFRQGSKY